MPDLFQLNDEVEINQNDFISIDSKWIERIKKLAKNNISGKYRTCIHKSDEDNVHEMLIVHSRNTYVRPHKHLVNRESLQFLEGSAVSVIFNTDGSIYKSFKVGDPSSNDIFYYSMNKKLFHMLIIESDILVFKETVKGPFIRENTVYPKWAPNGKDDDENSIYIDKIKNQLELNSI